MSELKPMIEQSFSQYAGAVLQSRALVDVRDGLKPSARQIFYALYTDKFLSSKPYRKTLKAVGSLSRFYIHGDASAVGVLMRAGQSFAMRYPLIDVHGNAGTLMESGNWAHQRYTESRLSPICETIMGDIDKDTIEEWRDNYDDTEQYPSVLPSKGFYNIVNGTQGIAVGAASSIPQYNLREMNRVLETLLLNPNCNFEEIYIAPDFATGAILYNEEEIKESMKNGTGAACKLRSVVEFDPKERCFIVTEIPYGVYTNTICGELEEIINGEDNPGIERFNDLTGSQPLLKIYLTKRGNPDKVLKYLYKETSLQYYYGINFTMLDQGRFPRVFTWKEMLQAHINHEKEVYRRGFKYDLAKIEHRIHIIDGLLICLASIEEVVQTIKNSSSTAAASSALQTKFLLDEAQAKAVLDMKLSRLAHLEVKKLEDERKKFLEEANRIKDILSTETLFNQQLIDGWRDIAKKYGDERRTKIVALQLNDNDEPIETKQLSLSFTNMGAVFVNETSTLYAQRRNGTGAKFKLEKEEYVVDSLVGSNTDTILFFTSCGNFYHMRLGDFTIGEKQYLSTYVNFLSNEYVVAAAITSVKNAKSYIIFLTKKGILKKSSLTEYNLKRNAGAAAIKLDKNDEIVSVLFTDSEKIGIASKNGSFIIIETSTINPIGRVTRGVCGIKLNANDEVVSGRVILNDCTELISVSTDGYIKRSPISDFRTTGRATKGIKIQNTGELCDFLPISNLNDILVVSAKSQIRLKISDIPLLGRGAQGVKAIKLTDNSKIMNLNDL